MENIKELNGEIPEIYCALSIMLKKDTSVDLFLSKLRDIGIFEYRVYSPKYEDAVYIDIAEIYYDRNWYLDDVLSKMFSHIDGSLAELKKLIDQFAIKLEVDIAFCQYGSYPALEFVGDNMKKIRFLEAEISIDAY